MNDVSEELLQERDGPVVTLTLNRPGVMNALSPTLLEALCRAFRDLQADASVRAVILTGSGRAFCAGLDLKVLSESDSGLGAFAIHADNDLEAAISAFDRPLIIAVNGVAATGGFELALMGDILIAGASARFADTHCRVGLAPGWGLSQKLARIIGPSRAKEAHFSGNFISAEQADRWGLVSRVVPDDALLQECRQLAADIAEAKPETVITYKRLVDEGLAGTLAQGQAMERHVMAHANRSVSGDAIGQRRGDVIRRGQAQSERSDS
jgi:enoyl-CoA hydratase